MPAGRGTSDALDACIIASALADHACGELQRGSPNGYAPACPLPPHSATSPGAPGNPPHHFADTCVRNSHVCMPSTLPLLLAGVKSAPKVLWLLVGPSLQSEPLWAHSHPPMSLPAPHPCAKIAALMKLDTENSRPSPDLSDHPCLWHTERAHKHVPVCTLPPR